MAPSSSPSSSPELPVRLPHGKKGAAFTLKDKGNMLKVITLQSSWFYCWNVGPPPSSSWLFSSLSQQSSPSSVAVTTTKTDDSRLIVGGDGVNDNDGVVDKNIDGPTVTRTFLPMIWGYYPKSFLPSIEKIIQQQHPCMILMFNEPDNKKQSNISVDKAIEAWKQLQTQLNIPLTVTSLTTSSSTSTTSRPQSRRPWLVSPGCVQPLGDWMKDFMIKVKEQHLTVDVVAVHYYGGANAEIFQNHMKNIYQTYNNRPIIIAEMAVADWKAKRCCDNRFSRQQVLQFMQTVLPWMQSQSWIVGYAWFSFDKRTPHGTSSALFEHDDEKKDNDDDEEGVTLTPLGRYYASFLATTDSNKSIDRTITDINERGNKKDRCPCSVQ